MGACAQIAVFTYAVMRRTPRYEIRLEASFADNLMNSGAHCVGSFNPTQKGLPALDSDASYNCGFSRGKWPVASHHDGAAFTPTSMSLIG